MGGFGWRQRGTERCSAVQLQLKISTVQHGAVQLQCNAAQLAAARFSAAQHGTINNTVRLRHSTYILHRRYLSCTVLRFRFPESALELRAMWAATMMSISSNSLGFSGSVTFARLYIHIHTLVTGGFNPHRRLYLESAGLWLNLQTCNLLYSIFPDVSYRMLKI